MTVSSFVNVVAQGREYQGLPAGIQPWNASLAEVGDASAGIVDMELRFNPDALETFQTYVSISKVGIRTGVADPLDMDISLEALHWEKSLVAASMVGVLQTVFTESAVVFAAVYDEGSYLGRTVAGTEGILRIRGANINTATYSLSASGLLSDRPFMHNKHWSV